MFCLQTFMILFGILFFKEAIASCDLLSLQYQLMSVVNAQRVGDIGNACKFFLYYMIDMAPTRVNELDSFKHYSTLNRNII